MIDQDDEPDDPRDHIPCGWRGCYPGDPCAGCIQRAERKRALAEMDGPPGHEDEPCNCKECR